MEEGNDAALTGGGYARDMKCHEGAVLFRHGCIMNGFLSDSDS
jgi:hypothetical protein